MPSDKTSLQEAKVGYGIEGFLVRLNQLLLDVLNNPEQKDDFVLDFIRSDEYEKTIGDQARRKRRAN